MDILSVQLKSHRVYAYVSFLDRFFDDYRQRSVLFAVAVLHNHLPGPKFIIKCRSLKGLAYRLVFAVLKPIRLTSLISIMGWILV